MRTFIAVDLDPAVKTALAGLLRKLRWRGPKGITWVREAGLHITLKFLGEIDEAMAGRVGTALESAAAAVPAFRLAVRGTGAFPGAPRAPRVLWAGTDEPAPFADLFSRLETGLEALGFARETRPFHPHLTLGRVKSPSGVRDVLGELERWRDVEFGAMTVSGVTLFKSALRPDGAVYSPLTEARLG